jgi:short-subunit dehydrogenase
MKLKRLQDQVIVITGATSGIGLVTARKAGRRGARVVLSARNDEALSELVLEINGNGGEAISVVADVGKEEQIRNVAKAAIDAFGRIDTWVNNAGVSIYGELVKLSMEDQRRLFETNFWGTVHGSRIAVEHMRSRGGALINVGSVASVRSIPLQGIYCASKHAVKGYTQALRMELEKERVPIAVTLIKPSPIDTPYKKHAKNYLSVQPKNPPPVYAPDIVADAILHCAEHPTRDLVIGGGGRLLTALEHLAPRVADRYAKLFLFDQQKTSEPAGANHGDALWQPGEGLRERGGFGGHVSESSVYTQAALHPIAASVVAVGCGLLVAAALHGCSSKRTSAGHLPQES